MVFSFLLLTKSKQRPKGHTLCQTIPNASMFQRLYYHKYYATNRHKRYIWALPVCDTAMSGVPICDTAHRLWMCRCLSRCDTAPLGEPICDTARQIVQAIALSMFVRYIDCRNSSYINCYRHAKDVQDDCLSAQFLERCALWAYPWLRKMRVDTFF